MRKLVWKYKVRNMPTKRLPAIPNRPVWEKVAKGRAGIGWDSVVEKVWKGIEGNQEEVMPAGNFGKYMAEVEERIERRERLALRNEVETGKHLEIYEGLREGIGMKYYLHGQWTSRKR